MTTPPDAWPRGDLLEWFDDETRTHHDFFNETTRPYSDEENEAADLRAAGVELEENALLLLAAAKDSLAGNRAFIANVAPTNAQSVAQIRALTRQMNAVIRLVIGDTTATD